MRKILTIIASSYDWQREKFTSIHYFKSISEEMVLVKGSLEHEHLVSSTSYISVFQWLKGVCVC